MDVLDFLSGALLGGLVAGSIAYGRGLKRATTCGSCGNPVDQRPFCDRCVPEMVIRDWAA
jgi:outer membrane lipoprotein SlyB